MKSISIYGRFSLLVAVVSLPFILYIGTTIYDGREKLIAATQVANRTLAEVTATHVYRTMSDVLILASELARRPELRAGETANCNRVLADFQQLHVGFLAASFNDEHGVMRCLSTATADAPEPVSIADLEWFTRVKSELRPIISQPYFGRIQKRWLVIAAAPVFDGASRFIGSVVIPLDLRLLGRGIEPSLPKESYIAIVDGNGTVLTRAPDFDKWVGTNVKDNELIAYALRTGLGVARGPNAVGVDSLIGFAALPELDWRVIVGGDAATILAPAQRQVWFSMAVGAASVFATLFIAFTLAAPLIRAIRELASMTRTLATGQFDVRIPEHGPGEIANLARDFNFMAQSLHVAQSALRDSEKRFRQMFENNSAVMLLIHPASGQIVDANAAAARFYGYAIDVLRSMNVDQISDRSPDETGTERTRALQELRNEFYFSHRLANGEVRTVQVRSSPINVGDRILLFSIVNDVTQQKWAEDEIRSLAYFDALTGLPNRRLLFDRLRHAMASSLRHRRGGAVFILDLDHFKTLNDTRGHDVGDLLLREVAQRLNACVRESDTVARLGGDEFVVLLEDLSPNNEEAVADARCVADKIRSKLNEPYQLEGSEHHTTPIMGIALFGPKREIAIEDIFKQADLAMYQAKTDGRNAYRFFDPDMQNLVSARVALETDLRRAVAHKQFDLYYQVQVESGGKILGAEALLRWNHPERGILTPSEFIHVAEETGLIVPLGAWALETACRQLVKWNVLPGLSDLTLAVNVSPRQFAVSSFVQDVVTLLETTQAEARKLKLELTENLLLKNESDVVEKMQVLQSHGVGFSLDDFGTGYSSLAYLKRLPLQQLKIDRSFVRDILVDPNDAAIAQMIVTLGKSLGISVMAEGVEREEQRQALEAEGCRYFQGYFFGRPVPLHEFEALVLSAPPSGVLLAFEQEHLSSPNWSHGHPKKE